MCNFTNVSPRFLRRFFASWTAAFLFFPFGADAQGTASVQAVGLASAMNDLPAEVQVRVDKAAKAFMTRADPSADRDVGDLAWDCMAAAALFEIGEKQAEKKLTAIGNLLVEKAIRSSGQAIGWPYIGKSANSCPNGGLDAFGDGTCNNKDTVYSFQTGMAIACLAKAGALLNRPEFTAQATQAFNYWQKFILEKTACRDCIYYLYSDNPNDRGRYVRNVNVFMAFGAAMLGEYGRDATALRKSNQAMLSELDERSAGNRGYLGHLDPDWIAKRAVASQNIENHAAAVALVSDLIGGAARSPAIRDHAVGVWNEWATCNNKRCETTTCNVWGGDAQKCQATLTATHCGFRKRQPLAAVQCKEYLSRVSTIPSYALWATIVGGTERK